jgi:EmrB/QacA subfamily drug resistance transporter
LSPSSTPSTPVNRNVVLATVLVCQLMVVLDATVVNIALPQIQHTFGLSNASLSWVINAYTLTFGGLLLLGARMGDVLGQRITFLTGITLFTVSSLVGGAAQNSAELIGSRMSQGVGAALAAPAALAILTTMFPQGRERTRALGYYTAVSIGGGAVGLVLGGVLTQFASWRWVFLINVPIGVMLLLVASRTIVRTPRITGSFDIAGALLSTVGMTSVTFGFVHAAQDGWSDAVTIGAFALGIVLLIAFILNERMAAAPITPLRLFQDRNRAAAYFCRLLLVAGMQGMFFFLTQFLQEVLGYSAVATGFGFVPITIAVFVSSQAASRDLIDRFGARLLVGFGLTMSTVAALWLTRLHGDSSYGSVLGPLLLAGFGNGLAFVPLTNAALAGVRDEDAGAGAGLVNAVQQVGGSVGLALLVSVSSAGASAYLSGAPTGLSSQQLANEAFTHGADRAFAVSAVLLFITAMVALFVIRPEAEETAPSSPDGIDAAEEMAATVGAEF